MLRQVNFKMDSVVTDAVRRAARAERILVAEFYERAVRHYGKTQYDIYVKQFEDSKAVKLDAVQRKALDDHYSHLIKGYDDFAELYDEMIEAMDDDRQMELFHERESQLEKEAKEVD